MFLVVVENGIFKMTTLVVQNIDDLIRGIPLKVENDDEQRFHPAFSERCHFDDQVVAAFQDLNGVVVVALVFVLSS